MATAVNVTVHESVFPENVVRELRQSLRDRVIPPKFHYVSYKQAQKWLAVHEAHSPARTDPACLAIYEASFAAVAKALSTGAARVVGLGCGGGQKEAQLLRALAGQGRELSYTPCDVSLPLVLTASEAATAVVPGLECGPLVCDLTHADDLMDVLNSLGSTSVPRIFTFFGMIPNLEPEVIMPRLAALIRPGDFLLFSANLAPGADYAAGVRRILPGYANPETAEWLLTFLYELGVEQGVGALHFSVEDSAAGLKRIVADYCFGKEQRLRVGGDGFEFKPGGRIRLFFSYRYTPDRVAALLAQFGLAVVNHWITPSGEEGVFLCQTKNNASSPARP